MHRIAFVSLALVGLFAAGATAANADSAPVPTQAVSYETFQAVTNTPSVCAVVVPDVSYVIPVPASITAEVTGVTRPGYHSITGYGLINAGAYPGQVLQKTETSDGVYPPHQYDVWVPAFNGRSCNQWVHLVAQD